jgi:RNA polymerase sigma factor (sigma-70 family)
MSDLAPSELDLTPELLDYARYVAFQEARKICPMNVLDDVVQAALLNLIRWPPRFDPTRGTAEQTFLHSCILNCVRKAADSVKRQTLRFEPLPAEMPRPTALDSAVSSEELVEDMLRYVVDEQSKAMCRMFIQCNGNVSETARRLGVVEGTVRHRLNGLALKLRMAGFDPFNIQEGP